MTQKGVLGGQKWTKSSFWARNRVPQPKLHGKTPLIRLWVFPYNIGVSWQQLDMSFELVMNKWLLPKRGGGELGPPRVFFANYSKNVFYNIVKTSRPNPPEDGIKCISGGRGKKQRCTWRADSGINHSPQKKQLSTPSITVRLQCQYFVYLLIFLISCTIGSSRRKKNHSTKFWSCIHILFFRICVG